MILLIIAGSGIFKQIMEDSGVSNELATSLEQLPVHPLIFGLVDLCRDPFVRGIGCGGGVDGGGRGDAFSYANGCEPELDGFIFRSG